MTPQEWKNFVEKEAEQNTIIVGDECTFKAGAQFVLDNLDKVPQVSELMDASENLAKDCGCISPYRIDVQQALSKLRGGA